MPLDATTTAAAPQQARADLHRRVADLNAQMRNRTAADVIRTAHREIAGLALVSSFGADSVALLHLAASLDRDLPVLFIDTEMLFPETLDYQQDVAAYLGLRAVRVLRSDRLATADPRSDLHATHPDACCALRKTEPLQHALTGTGGWISGRKRFQSRARASLEHFEVDGETQRIKVNPLAYWRAEDVTAYIDAHQLPRHPLIARGFASIGCRPCTSPVAPGEAPRAGRWRSRDKDECGIHFANGRALPAGDRP